MHDHFYNFSESFFIKWIGANKGKKRRQTNKRGRLSNNWSWNRLGHIFFILQCWILPGSASTQSQLKVRLMLALFPADPPTHPAPRPPTRPTGTVVYRTSLGVLLTVSRPLNAHFQTTLRKNMSRSSFTEGCLPPNIVFQQRSSYTEGHLPPKVVFHWWSSSTEGRLPPKVVFHWRLLSTKGRLPKKVVFHRRRLPPIITPWLNSQHTESQPPILLRSGLKFCSTNVM